MTTNTIDTTGDLSGLDVYERVDGMDGECLAIATTEEAVALAVETGHDVRAYHNGRLAFTATPDGNWRWH